MFDHLSKCLIKLLTIEKEVCWLSRIFISVMAIRVRVGFFFLRITMYMFSRLSGFFFLVMYMYLVSLVVDLKKKCSQYKKE